MRGVTFSRKSPSAQTAVEHGLSSEANKLSDTLGINARFLSYKTHRTWVAIKRSKLVLLVEFSRSRQYASETQRKHALCHLKTPRVRPIDIDETPVIPPVF